MNTKHLITLLEASRSYRMAIRYQSPFILSIVDLVMLISFLTTAYLESINVNKTSYPSYGFILSLMISRYSVSVIDGIIDASQMYYQ